MLNDGAVFAAEGSREGGDERHQAACDHASLQKGWCTLGRHRVKANKGEIACETIP